MLVTKINNNNQQPIKITTNNLILEDNLFILNIIKNFNLSNNTYRKMFLIPLVLWVDTNKSFNNNSNKSLKEIVDLA